ncbi:hypothetical protein WMY93_007449 [Mugilogobius chulae]|uniref:Uncharacterized protein n=1 Tax=Mugilogobius chulae TaxID=88201 RepID=A0AAW0PRP0_9GOBI
MGGNARTHARKRSRSRSPVRTNSGERVAQTQQQPREGPTLAQKQPRSEQLTVQEPERTEPRGQSAAGTRRSSGRAVSMGGKKSQSDANRRNKRTDDRDSPRVHDLQSKDGKDGAHRWRSGWEDNKHVKEELHKSTTPRHKPYPSPRTAKHRLSVDANLQIPEALTSTSKKDLLRRASRRLENGEISEEEFLNLAHRIKNLFQYQEEKQQQRGASTAHDRDYNHGKEFPPLKSLPGLRFKRRADPRDTASALDDEGKSGYDRRFPERRADGPSLPPQEPPRSVPPHIHLSLTPQVCTSTHDLPGPPTHLTNPPCPCVVLRFERERLSPLPPPLPVARDPPETRPTPARCHASRAPTLSTLRRDRWSPDPPRTSSRTSRTSSPSPSSRPGTSHRRREATTTSRRTKDRAGLRTPPGRLLNPEPRFDGPRFDPPSRFNAPDH